jgi:hypothetical protein
MPLISMNVPCSSHRQNIKRYCATDDVEYTATAPRSGHHLPDLTLDLSAFRRILEAVLYCFVTRKVGESIRLYRPVTIAFRSILTKHAYCVFTVCCIIAYTQTEMVEALIYVQRLNYRTRRKLAMS